MGTCPYSGGWEPPGVVSQLSGFWVLRVTARHLEDGLGMHRLTTVTQVWTRSTLDTNKKPPRSWGDSLQRARVFPGAKLVLTLLIKIYRGRKPPGSSGALHAKALLRNLLRSAFGIFKEKKNRKNAFHMAEVRSYNPSRIWSFAERRKKLIWFMYNGSYFLESWQQQV
jgi:hypothetical protein